MDNRYFQQALQDFVSDFGYGGAIRHMVDRGYTVDMIMKTGDINLPRKRVEEMVERYLSEKKEKGNEKK